MVSPSAISADSQTAEILVIEKVCEHGDVYLVPGSKPAKKYLVSSAVLSNVSPVFRAMFSDRFTEGQALSATCPKDVELKDDDPRAISIMLRLIHLKPTDEESFMCPSEGPVLAVICDKYDTVPRLKQIVSYWFDHIKHRSFGFSDLCALTATALGFNEAAHFQRFSARTAYNTAKSFQELIKKGDSPLPDDILESLHRLRETTRASVREVIHTIVEGVKKPNCDCHFTITGRDVLRLITTIERDSPTEFIKAATTFVEALSPDMRYKCGKHNDYTSGVGGNMLRQMKMAAEENLVAIAKNQKGLELRKNRPG
ncbi:Hypothetical protein D9617_3g022380 [Elsinoe fawcettii]|nr:Hypothetical protein D9617_3g022380 [Elsinoe fawcettii]